MLGEVYEGGSIEALEEQMANLEAQMVDLEAQRTELQTKLDIARSSSTSTTESAVDAPSRTGRLNPSMLTANISRSHVDRLKLYKWGNESITKSEVLSIVNGLPEPYNSEVSEYVEKNDIRGLQRYLNGKIDSGEIYLDGLTRALDARNIPFTNGHILEDNKFGPQTLETIRFLIRQLKGEPEEPEYSEVNVRVEIRLPETREVRPEDLVELPQGATAEFEDGKGVDKEKGGEQEIVVVVRVGGRVEKVTVVVIVDVENQTARVEKKKEEEEGGGQKKKRRHSPDRLSDDVEREPNLDWIKEEMSDAMQDIKNKGEGNRSPERNSYDKSFDIDMSRNRVILKTWGISLHSSAKEHIADNRCEIDWKTGDMYVVCGKNEYKMPLHFGRFALDSDGYPTGDNVNNREKIRAFTEIGNLMNMLKAQGVFNGKGAIEYQVIFGMPRQSGINLNDGLLGGEYDTLLVSEGELNRLSNVYSHLGVKFDKATKIQIASLLTAMKLDLGKIRWNPDIERTGIRGLGIDPLNNEHKRWVKHYSKTYSGA